MERATAAPRRAPGRPLSFDREQALEEAMLLFWKHGYETTSISDLTAAMQITAPSLYTAFGDKKRLFLEAVSRYQSRGPQTALQMIASAATARDAARTLLEGAAVAYTGKGDPKGCLLASAAATGSAAARDVQTTLAAIRRGIETALRKKIVGDVAAGTLPSSTDAATLAAFTLAAIQGMSVAARDGADRKKLEAIAATALSVWPTSLEPGGHAPAMSQRRTAAQ